MKTNILKQSVVAALMVFGASAAQAQTVTFDLNYLAGVTTGTATQTVNAVASGSTISFGTMTLTDLSDLALGDGATGVRVAVNLNASAFNSISSGVGSLYLGSWELNFPGTTTANAGGELSSALTAPVPAWRYVSGVNINTARSGGPIEFAEDGGVNGWGQTVGDPSFEQEINYLAGSFTGGQSSTIDFLNGQAGYTGFTVANLLANPVDNAATDALNPTLRPDAFAWFKIRATGGGIIANTPGVIKTNSTGAQAYNILAVVPEPETYGMMLAGLGLMGMVARRRRED